MSFYNQLNCAQVVAQQGMYFYRLLHQYDDLDCVNLYHGDGAFPPHEEVRDALKAVADSMLVWNSGAPELQRSIQLQRYRVPTHMTVHELHVAILKDFSATMPSNFNSKDAVVHTAGGVTHLATALFNYFRKTNARIMMFTPTYTSFLSGACTVGCEVVLVEPTNDGYITPEHIENALQCHSDVKCLFLINPNNPTGQVFSANELEKIAHLAIKHDLLIIVDEVFHKLVFERDVPFISLASIQVDGHPMFERTITLRSVSKDHGLAAIRSGYAIGPYQWMEKLLINQFTFSTTFNVDDLAQYVTVAALSKTPTAYFIAQRNLLRHNRDLVMTLIKNINDTVGYEALTAVPAKAGMFQIIDAAALRKRHYRGKAIESDATLCELLLIGIDSKGVALLPGSCGGYHPTDMKLRLTLSSPQIDIHVGMQRISQFIHELSDG